MTAASAHTAQFSHLLVRSVEWTAVDSLRSLCGTIKPASTQLNGSNCITTRHRSHNNVDTTGHCSSSRSGHGAITAYGTVCDRGLFAPILRYMPVIKATHTARAVLITARPAIPRHCRFARCIDCCLCHAVDKVVGSCMLSALHGSLCKVGLHSGRC